MILDGAMGFDIAYYVITQDGLVYEVPLILNNTEIEGHYIKQVFEEYKVSDIIEIDGACDSESGHLNSDKYEEGTGPVCIGEVKLKLQDGTTKTLKDAEILKYSR